MHKDLPKKVRCPGYCRGKGFYMSKHPMLGGDDLYRTHCGICNGLGWVYERTKSSG